MIATSPPTAQRTLLSAHLPLSFSTQCSRTLFEAFPVRCEESFVSRFETMPAPAERTSVDLLMEIASSRPIFIEVRPTESLELPVRCMGHPDSRRWDSSWDAACRRSSHSSGDTFTDSDILTSCYYSRANGTPLIAVFESCELDRQPHVPRPKPNAESNCHLHYYARCPIAACVPVSFCPGTFPGDSARYGRTSAAPDESCRAGTDFSS